MRKLFRVMGISIVLIIGTGLFASCKSTELYDWKNYGYASYMYSVFPSSKNQKKLLEQYEEIIMSQRNSIRGTVPPGIYADYGYFLYKEGRYDEAERMLEKEVELYPESREFVKKLVQIMKSVEGAR